MVFVNGKGSCPLRLGTLNSEGLKNNHVVRKLEKHQQICTIDQHIEGQFGGGCLLACIIAWA
ncbi:Ribosomal protein S8e family protein [Prunus dulcis]|uniref:Ribosomal protein S8e family protein n=1 Tax=Prunus dulcis TaxID=3755 RepID=A0A4Y1RGH1_PRUDU|nr:Ribosomal protein S8e family protein [Prunus dulcis]